MILYDVLPPAAGFLFCLLLGMAFSLMESTSLALNRTRLLQLFADEHPQATSEQEIFRDTKEVYFVSRLGLCVTLVAAGYCVNLLFLLATSKGLRPPLGWGIAGRRGAAAVLSLIATTPVYLFAVYGFPRFLMRQRSADDQALLPAWMRFFMRATRPLAVLSGMSRVLPLARFLPRHQLAKGDLIALVTDLEIQERESAAGSAGPLPEEKTAAARAEEEAGEQEIIYNILDLEETLVREVMRPINTVVAIRLSDLTAERVLALARTTGYSRFPVYRERITNLSGYVSVYDILHAEGPLPPIESLVTPAFFVPEFMRLGALLREFRDRAIQVAVVVDEYGACSGWITREDVFAEIVGELDPHRRAVVEHCPDGSYLVDGQTRIDELAEELPLHFEEPRYDTVAGFVLMELGAIPAEGDEVATGEALFRVEKVEGNRIARVRIRLRTPGDTPPSPLRENPSAKA